MAHFETFLPANPLKRSGLMGLGRISTLIAPVAKVQRDDFRLFRTVENPVRKQTLYDQPKAAKRQSRTDRNSNNDPRQQNDVHNQRRDIVAGIEIGVLVPGYVGIVIYRSEKQLCI